MLDADNECDCCGLENATEYYVSEDGMLGKDCDFCYRNHKEACS